MIINGVSLILMEPIRDMIGHQEEAHGRSWGLTEDGYDFRLKQNVLFSPPIFKPTTENQYFGCTQVWEDDDENDVPGVVTTGRTALASSIEYFQIPKSLSCRFSNKSKNARDFFDASITTGAKPGWCGYLTIELVFHGLKDIYLPAGTPILSATFQEIKEISQYDGTFQNQPDRPIGSSGF